VDAMSAERKEINIINESKWEIDAERDGVLGK